MILSVIVVTVILQAFIFCQRCGTLGYLNEDGRVHCDKCKSISDCENIITETGVINPKEMNSKSEVTDLSRLTISNSLNNFKPKFSLELRCIFCKEEKITSELRQMDQSDEPEVRFLICHGCGKTWRD